MPREPLVLLLILTTLRLGAAASKPNIAQEGKLLLLRHCPRVPFTNDRHPPLAPGNYSNADNFSSRSFPSTAKWQVAQGQCTPAGVQLARQMGAALPSVLGTSRTLRVLADQQQRCQDTAAALGLNLTAVEVNQALFDPLSALKGCKQPAWQQTVERQVARLEPELKEARMLLKELQELLGKGVAPPLQDIPDNVSNGYLVGGLRVASEVIMETFMLERMSALPVAWDQLSDAGLQRLMQLRDAYFPAMYGGFDIAQRYGSGVLAELMSLDVSQTTSVLVGHDTSLQAIQSLLGLGWQCGPWTKGSVEPLLGILFTASEGKMSVQSVCPTLNSEAPFAVGSASFAGGKSELPITDFKSLVRPAIAWQCVNTSDAGKERQVIV
eukprot:CAMPEP_0172680652 /NCGR_PEP_ID=MMETSP1074-20121228/16914_1 /TAXON_ID=2916 /ORGANISM="Ceratium fusus, Strain PA161109" /LENGTH=381 /DNA_ID=CAMNT_0013499015 /DNA_START=51 /DNA_END=1196 /DNA_ORIENTATION=-